MKLQTILVVNAGSSSIKYQLIEVGSERRIARGLIERIGEATGRVRHWSVAGGDEPAEVDGRIADHTAGFAAMVEAFERAGQPIESAGIVAVGHRVVQGGADFTAPTLIDDEVERRILELAELAPLHNPGHYSAIRAARTVFPDVPHVAVFDTTFHQTMPPEAYTYAIDPDVAAEYGVRRYGFHGISHQVVSRRAAELVGRPVDELKQIVLHLGNGASATAVDRGRSVDTSMGLTPLEGLVMGSRSGDIDPGALLHLLRAGLGAAELDELLNARSGLLGLSGHTDMRDVRAAVEAGEPQATLALDVYAHRIRHYLGAYLLELGGADTIVFTAGVGENYPHLRAMVCAGLGWFGIELDPVANGTAVGVAQIISVPSSRVTVLVMPTDEEAEIAHQTWVRVSGAK